jgi:ribokinase
MSEKNDLLSIGHTALDYIIKVEKFPIANASTAIEKLKNLYGGAAANVAVVGANIGLKTSLISAVGGEFIGSPYQKQMLNLNINIEDMIIVDDENTPTAFVLTDKNDDQISYFYWGAGREFENNEVSKEAVKKVKAVHLATGDPNFNYRASSVAKSLDKLISFDPGQDLHTYTNNKLKELIKNCSILFGNHFEIAKILERLNLDIQELRSLGPEIVIKTKGKEGSVIYSDKKIKIDSIYRPAIDPTGAGDSYRAGFLKYYLNGESLGECAKFASAVSSFIIEKEGCQTNIPTFQEALNRMEDFY